MSQIIDLTGQQFGYWTVVEQVGTTGQQSTLWRCHCKCGVEKIIVGVVLRDGRSQSCGCKKIEELQARSTTHGHSRTSTYQSWFDMKRRCQNKTREDYPRYGGRGIKVCERWQSYENFLADMGEKPAGYTIDRIDAKANYEPGNCQWITKQQQVKRIPYDQWKKKPQ